MAFYFVKVAFAFFVDYDSVSPVLISLIRQITSLLLGRKAEGWATGGEGAVGYSRPVGRSHGGPGFCGGPGNVKQLLCVLPQIQLSTVH